MAAVAIPAGRADGGHFGVTLLGPAFSDELLGDLATRLEDGERPTGMVPAVHGRAGAQLLVVGAHMTGGPLNHELTRRGGRLIAAALTAPSYRLYALSTTPPKPGLVRVPGAGGGASIEGELWALPEAGLASLLQELPSPMTFGRVRLADGAEVVGFLCEPAALEGAQEITAFGGWRAYNRSAG
jgi:allophanate hydrolase